MSSTSTMPREQWSSRLAFILAASGSAIGLGNIWRFPYITGEYGGGAFVLFYIICVAMIGIPIMMAEILMGRRGGRSPIESTSILAQMDRRSTNWKIIGVLGIITGFIILSFYSVVAGWSLSYIKHALSGDFNGASATDVKAVFSHLTGDPGRVIFWHTMFMVFNVIIVTAGIKAGLERAVKILMPALFAMLIIMVIYAIVETDKFDEGLKFLFNPDFSKLSWEAAVVAMGHAFFTLSLGMGAIMVYGSYMPKHISIGKAAITVSILDTLVALLAGMAIFPILFAHGMAPSQGAGLAFITFPIALGDLGAIGVILAALFFLLLSFAALTSSISIIEPTTAWLQDKGLGRVPAVLLVAGGAWLLGIASCLSLNVWSDVKIFNQDIMSFLSNLTSDFMLPIGGLLIAVFVGWVISRQASVEELEMGDGLLYRMWYGTLRFIAIPAIIVVFVWGIVEMAM